MARVTITIEGPNFIQNVSRGRVSEPLVLPTFMSVAKTCIAAYADEWPAIQQAMKTLIDAVKAVNEGDDADLRHTCK